MIHRSIIFTGFILSLPLCFLFAKTIQQNNLLTKVFFHKGQISDKIVCYFSKEPLCNHIPKAYVHHNNLQANNVSKIQKQFFMPLTAISGDARIAIPKINTYEHEHYSIKFNEVKQPLEGIQIIVVYDSRYTGFELETFEAIHTHKGLVFKFHHKEILQEINKKTDHILQYASNAKRVSTIAIDSGHGGDDSGKVGCYHTKEKDINLTISTYLGKLLEKRGYNVIFTRPSDIFVPLDARTTFANVNQADLFISIHANGSSKEEISGIETYWAPQSLLKCELNDIDEQSKEMLLQLSEKRDFASKKLANTLHTSVLRKAYKFYPVKDRQVKESVSQVLLGTDSMPAALIELGFLSNKEETNFLIQPSYQQALAQGICEGIELYLKKV